MMHSVLAGVCSCGARGEDDDSCSQGARCEALPLTRAIRTADGALVGSCCHIGDRWSQFLRSLEKPESRKGRGVGGRAEIQASSARDTADRKGGPWGAAVLARAPPRLGGQSTSCIHPHPEVRSSAQAPPSRITSFSVLPLKQRPTHFLSQICRVTLESLSPQALQGASHEALPVSRSLSHCVVQGSATSGRVMARAPRGSCLPLVLLSNPNSFSSLPC